MAEINIGLPDISKQIAQAETYLRLTKEQTEAIMLQSKAMKDLLSNNKMSSAKDFNEIAKAMKDAAAMLKEYNDYKKDEARIEKDLQDLRSKKEKADAMAVKTEREKLKLTIDQNKEKDRQAKIDAKLLNEEKKLNSEYSKQSKALNDLRNKYKDLILVQGKESAESKKLLSDITKLDAKLKAVDASVGQGHRTVGLYTDGINKARIGVLSFANALGVVTGVQLFTSALKGSFNIIKENEDAFASLSAITGLTGDKFTVFETAINDTANRLKVSSTDVAAAAEKIASAQPKLLENADALAAVTEQAIILNKAIKGDLTETSLALVGVMNQFGLEASEASNVINILAAGSQAGAADVNQINESMVKFGTTAKLLNISVEESVGAIETLGEKAIFGSEAGTALRNILLKMASIDVLPEKALKQLETYGVNTDIVKDTTLSFEERLRELSKVAGDSTAIMQIFGTENATAATVLLNSVDTYSKMTDAVTGTNVATEQAAINSDTLSGVIEELKAAWENLVVEWANGTDVGGTLKDVIRFIAENLKTIITVVFTGIKAWAAYRVALMLWNKEGKGLIPTLISMTTHLGNSMKGVKGLTGVMKGLGAAMKSISFAGWASILVTVVPLIWDLADSLFGAEKGAKELTLAEQSLDNVTKKTAERLIEEEAELTRVFEALKNTKAGTEERQKALDDVNAKYGLTLKNLSDEGAFVRQLDTAYNDLIATLERKIMQEVTLEEQTALIKSRLKLQKELAQLEKDAIIQSNDLNKTFQDFNTQEGSGIGRSPVETRILSIKEQIQDINDALAALNQQDTPVIGGGAIGEFENEGGKINSGKKALTAEEIRLQKLEALRKKHTEQLLQFEDSLIKKGVDRELIDEMLHEERADLYREELGLIQELGFTTRDEYNKTEHALLKHNEKQQEYHKTQMKRIEEEKKTTSSVYQTMAEIAAENAKKTEDSFKKSFDEMIESAKKLSESLDELIDKRIEAIDTEIAGRKDEVQIHEDRVSEMEELAREGVLTAEESIKAEEQKISNLQNSIQELERKKQDLLLLNLALQTAMNLAESGDGNAILKAGGMVEDLKNKFQSFKEGTDRTGTGNVDSDGGSMAIIHPNEMIVQAPLAKELYKRGLDREDTVMYAMRYHDDMVNGAALENGSFTNIMTLATLNDIKQGQDKVVEAIQSLPKKMPIYKTDWDVHNKVVKETIITDNEIKNYLTRIGK